MHRETVLSVEVGRQAEPDHRRHSQFASPMHVCQMVCQFYLLSASQSSGATLYFNVSTSLSVSPRLPSNVNANITTVNVAIVSTVGFSYLSFYSLPLHPKFIQCQGAIMLYVLEIPPTIRYGNSSTQRQSFNANMTMQLHMILLLRILHLTHPASNQNPIVLLLIPIVYSSSWIPEQIV